MNKTVNQIGTVVKEVTTDTEPPWRTTIVMCWTAVHFKIDSSADNTIISEATNNILCEKPKLRPVTTKQSQSTRRTWH